MADCVVVTLTGATARTVRRLWAEIETRCGAGRTHPGADPHLTLAVAARPVAPDRLRDALAERVAALPAFSVSGAGYGVFVGRDRVPVVHLALTKTPRLAALHDAVLSGLAASGTGVDAESAPEFWRPHVNLADRGLDAESVGRVVAHLVALGPRHWAVEVGNVALLPASGTGAFSLPLAAPPPGAGGHPASCGTRAQRPWRPGPP